MMKERLEGYIDEALKELGIADVSFVLEHPDDMTHGDWATNAAMLAAKKVGKNPKTLAEEIVQKLGEKKDTDVLSVEVAGPGFINFKIAPAVFDKELSAAISQGDKWGRNETLKGKKVMVECTDPNPFKEFHIGHLMSNAIGESLSCVIEASGAEVKRACYQGDVGLHVAKAVSSMLEQPEDFWDSFPALPLKERLAYLGSFYVAGTYAYESGEKWQKPIHEINKKIYEKSDKKVSFLHSLGRKTSLEYFETMYQRLGTKFDFNFFESETGVRGKGIVTENKGKVFEESEGAIVFHAEKFNPKLHTRVFISKEGLPTYEAKELGLAEKKYETFPYDVSIVITGNEVNDYFQVLLEAMRQIFPELAAKTEHYSHGMLRLPTGKMSSRTGDVITATSLLDKAKELIMKNVEGVMEDVAKAAGVAAVKYSVLRQASGKDIIFDFDQSLSFEGDSGPYLQYTYARTHSVLEKAGNTPVALDGEHNNYGALPKLLVRFPEVVLRASREREPHYIANYLIEVAREFNSFYGNTTILDGASDQPYKLALTKAVGITLKNGLWLLGITAPAKM